MDGTTTVAASPRFSSWMTDRLTPDVEREFQRLLSYVMVNVVDGERGWRWVCLRGSQTAWVALKFDGPVLFYQCGCKRFREIAPEPCEHVAAAIVCLEHQSGGSRLQLHGKTIPV